MLSVEQYGQNAESNQSQQEDQSNLHDYGRPVLDMRGLIHDLMLFVREHHRTFHTEDKV